MEWLFEHPDPLPEGADGGAEGDAALAQQLQAADQALAERLQREGSGLTAGGAGNARARVRAGPNARTEAHFLTIGGRRVAFEPAGFGPPAAALPPTAAVPAAPELAEPS